MRLAGLLAAFAVGVAACSGPSYTVNDPLPHGTAISSAGTAVSAAGVAGISATLTVAGSGNVNAGLTSTPPGSTPVIMSAARQSGTTTQSVKTAAATPTPNTALVYVTITASAASTISGLPSSNFTFQAAPSGTVFLAFFNGTQWVTVGSAGTLSGNTETFGAVTFSPAIALAAGASMYLAVYTGGVLATPTPAPTPSPSPTASPTAAPLLADPGFEGTAAPIGSTITSTGWTQCTVNSLAAITYSGGINGSNGAQPYASATPFPLTTFTPAAGETPLAQIVKAGAAAPAGAATATPVPVSTTVPVHGGTQAAQFGGVFNTFSAEDVRYNGLCQNITVPAAGGHISGFVVGYGNEPSAFVENLLGTINPSSNNALTNILYMENVTSPTSPGDTAYRAIGPIAIPAGSTTLFVGMATKSGTTGANTFSSYWWVDDLSLVSP
jgi:hypothetical protein